MTEPAHPPIVSADEWAARLAELRVEEKALTRRIDALNAERRRLPMTPVRNDYLFVGEGSVGKGSERTLLDLFDGRRQLIVYHFMFGPDWDAGCDGCSWVVDAMSHPAHLHACDVSLVLASRASQDRLLAYRDRMGWDLPWYTATRDFNVDMGATLVTDDGDQEDHGVSVFLRIGDDVYRSYHTGDRGVEHLGSHWTYLDLVPFGRQELWEDSPEGWPQSATYEWHRRHDEYD